MVKPNLFLESLYLNILCIVQFSLLLSSVVDSKEASPPPSPFPLSCHIMTVQSNIRGNDHVNSHMTLTITPGGKVRPVWRETNDIHGLGVSIQTGQEMNINTVFSSSLHLPYLEKKGEKGWVGGL